VTCGIGHLISHLDDLLLEDEIFVLRDFLSHGSAQCNTDERCFQVLQSCQVRKNLLNSGPLQSRALYTKPYLLTWSLAFP